jgi:hypothetical protein
MKATHQGVQADNDHLAAREGVDSYRAGVGSMLRDRGSSIGPKLILRA